MDIIKTIAIATVVGIISVAGGYMLNKPTVEQPRSPVGAVSSPDIMSPYFSVGGTRFWSASTNSMTQATTTVCALQSPAATSTLVSGSAQFDVSSTTASLITFARSVGSATTTSLGTFNLSANAKGYGVASSTSNSTFAPNTYFVVGMQGNSGTFSPTGSCRALWMEL
jgi:hypothetical protein